MPTTDEIANIDNELPTGQQRDFDLFNFSPVPMWVYDTHTLQILAANDAAQKDYGYTLAEFLCLNVKALWPEEDVSAMMKMVAQKVKAGLPNKAIIRHIKKDGTIIHVDIKSKPLPSWGENTRIIIALDITSTKILHDLESHEKKVLELNSKSEISLTEVLAYYVKGIESIFPQMQCTIMEVKNNHIYSWVPSSVPKVFTDKIEGLKIGDNEGSCGTAAFLKQTIIVSDISIDPRWIGYKKLALSCDLFACWSQPIINSAGDVMATFAIYYNEIKQPNEDELKVIERASALLKIVLENRQYAEALIENNLLIKDHLERTEQHNLRLLDIAWAQTHLVRAPLARILGIIELLQDTKQKPTDKQLLDYLSVSAKELDEVIKGIIDKSGC